MGYKGFGPQLNRSFRAGNKIANDLTKMLLLCGAYATTKACASSNSNTLRNSSSYSSTTTRSQPPISMEPPFKIDLSLLSSLESEDVMSLKEEYYRNVDNYTHIDNQINDLISQRNRLINSVAAIRWIKWLLKKHVTRLEAEIESVQKQISILSSQLVVAQVNFEKFPPHSNFENIKNEGEKLIYGGSIVNSKYDNITLKEKHNYRELFYTTSIVRGSIPRSFAGSDLFLNLCAGDFTLSFTPIGIIFIVEKSFYVFEYSKIVVSYRAIQMREPDPNFSKNKHNIVMYEWKHSTLSGAPDMRYKNNQKLPIVEYGNIHIVIGSLEFNIVHPDKVLCDRFVKAISSALKPTDSNISLKTKKSYSYQEK